MENFSKTNQYLHLESQKDWPLSAYTILSSLRNLKSVLKKDNTYNIIHDRQQLSLGIRNIQNQINQDVTSDNLFSSIYREKFANYFVNESSGYNGNGRKLRMNFKINL